MHRRGPGSQAPAFLFKLHDPIASARNEARNEQNGEKGRFGRVEWVGGKFQVVVRSALTAYWRWGYNGAEEEDEVGRGVGSNPTL